MHVDLAIEDNTHNLTVEEFEARGFEQRLAELFIANSNQEGSSSSTVDSDESRTLIEEAHLWLETTPADSVRACLPFSDASFLSSLNHLLVSSKISSPFGQTRASRF